jgi:hypothetical protein
MMSFFSFLSLLNKKDVLLLLLLELTCNISIGCPSQ